MAPGPQDVEHRITGHAGQDAAGERAGDDLIADEEEDVHGAHLFHIATLLAVQPEHLGEALVLGLGLGGQAGRVVARGLGLAHAAFHRPHIVVADVDAHRVEALRIIRRHRAEDDVEEVIIRRADAEEGIHGQVVGADIERAALGAGDEIPLQQHELLEGVGDLVCVKGRHAEPPGRVVEPLQILAVTEQADAVIHAVVGLEALKGLLTVVQHHGGRAEGQVPVGDDARIVPALCRAVVIEEHVVCEVAAEPQVHVAWGQLVDGALVYLGDGQVHY